MLPSTNINQDSKLTSTLGLNPLSTFLGYRTNLKALILSLSSLFIKNLVLVVLLIASFVGLLSFESLKAEAAPLGSNNSCTSTAVNPIDQNNHPSCTGLIQYRVTYKSVDCTDNTADFEVQVKSDAAYIQPIMGDYNIAIKYDPTIIKRTTTGPNTLIEQNRYTKEASGLGDNYDTQNLAGSYENSSIGVISINGFYSGGTVGDVIPSSFTTVSTIRMKVVNPNKDLSLDITDQSSDINTHNSIVTKDPATNEYILIEAAQESENIDLTRTPSLITLCTPTKPEPITLATSSNIPPYQATTPSNTTITESPTYPTTTPSPVTTPTLQNTSKLELIKSGIFQDSNIDGIAQAGEYIKYSYSISNIGNVPITSINITDNKCNKLLPSSELAILAQGAIDSTTFTCLYTLTQTDITAGKVESSAEVSGLDPSNTTVKDRSDSNDPTRLGSDDPTIIPIQQVGKIQIDKTLGLEDSNNNGKLDLGEKVTYTYTLKNVGNVPLTDVIVTDPSSELNITGSPIPILAAGSSDKTTFKSSYIVNQADIANGSRITQITASGQAPVLLNQTQPSRVTFSSIDPITTTSGYSTPIALQSASTLQPYVAVDDMKEITFDSSITFNPLTNDNVPTDSKITKISGFPTVIDEPIKVNGGTVIVNIDGTIIVTPNKGSLNPVVFPYEVTTPTGSQVTGIDIISIIQAIDDGKSTQFNTPITYNPIIENDIVPKGSIVTSLNGKPIIENNPLLITNGKVVLNTDGTLTVTPASDFVNTLEFTYEITTPNGTKTSAINTITIEDTPNQKIIKEGTFTDDNKDGKAQIGETITYNFTVTNTGNIPLTDILITDIKCKILGGPIVKLAVGAIDTTTFTCKYALTSDDIKSGKVDNITLPTAKAPDIPAIPTIPDIKPNTPVELKPDDTKIVIPNNPTINPTINHTINPTPQSTVTQDIQKINPVTVMTNPTPRTGGEINIFITIATLVATLIILTNLTKQRFSA